MTLSIIMTILVIILGGWPSLFCSLFALGMSHSVSFYTVVLMTNEGSVQLHLAVLRIVFMPGMCSATFYS